MSATPSTVIGIELLVPGIDAALTTFTEALGCELAWRGPSPDVDAEVAVLDAGAITITLISPTSTGRPAIPDREPRLSQLVFGTDTGSVAGIAAALRGLGIAVAGDEDARVYVPPTVAEGVLGARTALVVTAFDEATSPES